MSLNLTPLLTAHLFVSEEILTAELNELLTRLEESRITVKSYGPNNGLHHAC